MFEGWYSVVKLNLNLMKTKKMFDHIALVLNQKLSAIIKKIVTMNLKTFKFIQT